MLLSYQFLIFLFKIGNYQKPSFSSQSKLRKHMLPNHAVQNCPLCANARSVETEVKSSWNSSLACPSIHPWVKAVPHIFGSRLGMKMSDESEKRMFYMLVSSQLCLVHSFHLSVLVLLSLKMLYQDKKKSEFWCNITALYLIHADKILFIPNS